MSLEIIRVEGVRPYPPRVSEFSRTYWQALAEGRLMTTKGSRSGRLAFPPRPFCPYSHERSVQWAELCGRGTLYSHTQIHAAPRAFAHLAPYRLCIADLEEGPRVAGRLLCEAPPRIDKPVTAVVLMHEDGPLLGFRQG